MVKGHNQQDQKKKNTAQAGAKTISAKEQRSSGDKGRNSDEKQSLKKSGDRKGLNDV